MDTGLPHLQLSGEIITVSDPANHRVNLGRFCLENRADIGYSVAVNVAWMEFGGGRQVLLSGLTVYDLNLYQLLNPAHFTIDAQASLPFLLGFTPTAYEPAFGECTAVGLRLDLNNVQLEALSGIEFIRHPADR